MEPAEDILIPDVIAVEANLTANDTTSSAYFYQVEHLTFLWVLFTMIVIGNGTVLIALSLSKGRKSRMNYFIKNLAAADLCVGLISVLTDIIWKITISWEAGLVACKLIRFSQAVVTYASTYVLVALSIDRYDAITHPMNFTGSWYVIRYLYSCKKHPIIFFRRRAKGLVIVAWALSFVFSSPLLHFFETTEHRDYGTQCWIDFDAAWKWKLYMTLVSVTLFVIPAFLIGGCYIIIVVTIWSKGKEMVPASATAGSTMSAVSLASNGHSKDNCEVLIKKKKKRRRNKKDGDTSEASRRSAAAEESESRRASSRGLIPKAKVKTVKMTFVIIFVFILCWSPYIVFDLLQVYDLIPTSPAYNAVATFIQSLAPLNSAANPLIYCLFSTNAGQNLCGIMFGCCRRRSRRGRREAGNGLVGGTGGSGGNGGVMMKGNNRSNAGLNTSSASSSSNQNTRSTALTFDSSTASSSSTSRPSRPQLAKNHSLVSWSAAESEPMINNNNARRSTLAENRSRGGPAIVNDF